MDESLIFLMPVPENTKPNELGSEIVNGATQRSPNQAHVIRYISCKFLTDGAITSCWRASPLLWGCAAKIKPLSPNKTVTSWRRLSSISGVDVLLITERSSQAIDPLLNSFSFSAYLRRHESHDETSLLLNMCLCCPEHFTSDLEMV